MGKGLNQVSSLKVNLTAWLFRTKSNTEYAMTLEVPLFHWRSYRLYILLLLMITLAITTINTMHIGVTLTCMVNASNYETTAVVNHDQCPNVVGRPEELGYTVQDSWLEALLVVF